MDGLEVRQEMKTILHLASMAILPLQFVIAEPTDSKVTFVSDVNGIRYTSETTTLQIVSSSEIESVRLDEHSTKTIDREPTGQISLREAIDKAEKVAFTILGDAYNSKNPVWIMTSATKEKAGSELVDGFYYRVSYCHRRGSAVQNKARGNLQVIVLLDGTVLPMLQSSRDPLEK